MFLIKVMSVKYLQGKEEYIKRYDRLTIWRCRHAEEMYLSVPPKETLESNGEKVPAETLRILMGSFIDIALYYMAGSAYKEKESTIAKWMDEDRRRDELLEKAEQPRLIRCKTCLTSMDCSTRNLWGDKDDRVMFFFECPKGCLPHRLVFENGEEYKREPEVCEKCNSEVERKSERKENIITTTKTCVSCGNIEIDELNLDREIEPEDPNYEKDKARFCMNDKEGYEFIDGERNREALNKILEKDKEKKQQKDLYDEVSKLKKLNIPQLKQHVAEALKDEVYSNLIFEQPRMEMIVSIGFTIEDSTTQHEHASRMKLQKLFKKCLEKTNWRLMSEGVSYRLGVLSGRLRVYEKEEDLVKLISQK